NSWRLNERKSGARSEDSRINCCSTLAISITTNRDPRPILDSTKVGLEKARSDLSAVAVAIFPEPALSVVGVGAIRPLRPKVVVSSPGIRLEYLPVPREAGFMARRFTSVKSKPWSTDWALGAIPIVAV